jgi:hypothetical protein
MADPRSPCWPSKTRVPALSTSCPPIFGAAMRTRVAETHNQEYERQKKKAPETTSRKPFS